MKARNWTGWLAGALVGAVFCYAGALKALEPGSFADTIFRFRLVPWPVCVAIALWLPWIEVFTGLALIAKKYYRSALAIGIGMTVLFLFALISAMMRGLNIDCGCFGGENEPTNSSGIWKSILLDVVLLALLAFAARQDGRSIKGHE